MQAVQSKDGNPVAAAISCAAEKTASWVLEQFYLQRQNAFLWCPVFLALGIGLYFSLDFEPPLILSIIIWLIASILLLLVFHTREEGLSKRIVYYLSFALVLITTGFTASNIRTQIVYTPVLEKKVGAAEVTGTIKSIEQLEGKKGSRIILGNVSIENLAAEKNPRLIRLQVRADENLAPGQKIKGLSGLNPPSSAVLPGAFNFRRYLYFQSIGAVGFFYRAPEIIEEGAVHSSLSTLRQKIALRIESILPPREAGFVTALITGQRKGISDIDQKAMRDAGLAHILAISGLHVGFVAGALFFTLRLAMAAIPALALQYPIKKIAAIAAMCGALFYMALAGATIPTQRAVLMSGIVFLAIILDRTPISLRLVAFSGFVILLTAPESLLSASFQLSFAAVVSLIAFYEATRKYWAVLYQRSGIPNKVGLYFLGVIVTTIIASLATAPFSVFHFQHVSALGSISNLAVVPIIAFWVMPCAILTMVLMPLGIEQPALYAMGAGTTQILNVAHWSANLPGAIYNSREIAFSAFVVFVIACLIVILWRGRGKLIAIPLLFFAITLGAKHKTPDIMVSTDHDLFAFKTTKSEIYTTTLRANKFTRENWERLSGLKEGSAKLLPQKNTENTSDIHCDTQSCRMTIKNKKIAFVKQPYALQADCLWADILVSENPIKTPCVKPLKIDKFDTWKNGAHAIWIGEDGKIRVESLASTQGDRPWVQSSKTTDEKNRAKNGKSGKGPD